VGTPAALVVHPLQDLVVRYTAILDCNMNSISDAPRMFAADQRAHWCDLPGHCASKGRDKHVSDIECSMQAHRCCKAALQAG